jgi:L-fuconolactonase
MSEQEPWEFVDAHIHLWDLDSHPWYPALQAPPDDDLDVGLGEMAGLRRNYLPADYRHDSAGYRVRKAVHVSAVTAPGTFVDESRWLDTLSSSAGWPTAVIGSLDPKASSSTWEEDLDTQAENPRFRGIRVLYGLVPGPRTGDLFTMLAERDLVFELVTSPAQMPGYARLLEENPSLRVVVEHAGWPENEDPDHVALWRSGMGALASLGDRVTCKVSGLAMMLHGIDETRLRPWVEGCLEAFGTERSFFASNFPVDALYGSYDDLIGAYRNITAPLGEAAWRRLFVTNAEGTYRI